MFTPTPCPDCGATAMCEHFTLVPVWSNEYLHPRERKFAVSESE